jgi:hypothetical protein
MKWITILAFLGLALTSYASPVRSIDSTQHEEPNNTNKAIVVEDERQLTDEVRQVQWNLVVIMKDGSPFNPDETFCTAPGFRNQPTSFYKFVHDVATVIAQSFLQKYALKRGLPQEYTVWNVEKINDKQVGRKLIQDDQSSRSLLTGFVFNLVVACRLCNPDNRDGRRLGSSNGDITSLSDNVSKVMYNLMRKRCGVTDLVEVTFEMVNV